MIYLLLRWIKVDYFALFALFVQKQLNRNSSFLGKEEEEAEEEEEEEE